jgi:hypothetical protein
MLPEAEKIRRILDRVGLTIEQLNDADDRYVLVAGK